jgi:hypothetical protein
MENFAGNTLVVLGGVFGGAIGFLILVLAGLIVALPYLFLTSGYLQARRERKRRL